MIAALCFGIFFFVIIAEYGLGYWIGAQLISKEVWNGNEGRNYNTNDVIAIFFAVITGAFALGQVGPSLQNISKAREAGYHIYKVIERQPPIKINDTNKKMATQALKGDIEFNNVTFRYPSRDDVVVLNNLSFTIKAGQKAAFVGETGCGKSTTIQLVERYYDANQG
jgi:ABC-type multidrug transport system fused ATPase/permease subunit